MKYIAALLFFILIAGCAGRLGKLPSRSNLKSKDFPINLSANPGKALTAQYLGCGGLYLQQDGKGILIDPFFSNQRIGKLAKSVLSANGRKRSVRSKQKMVEFGIKSIETQTGPLTNQVDAIFTAHSHYDHLLDVPAVFDKLEKKPMVFVSESGWYQLCANIINESNLEILEKYTSTQETSRPPIVMQRKSGKINIYPILADHNPHFNNIKVFSGSTKRPVEWFIKPYDKTRANDWLEGATFSFLIDYLDSNGTIELRLFVQSSSCNPPAGIPPLDILKSRDVDVAFLGVASYGASPDYPGNLLGIIKPNKVVWIHWEDFFRGYKRKPKTVRATDVVEFFEKRIQNLSPDNYYTPWPRVKMDIYYK